MILKKGITLIAALAAVLAITSGAFAANHYLITSSAQIKNGVISLSDLAPAARPALKGQQGAAGPQGPPVQARARTGACEGPNGDSAGGGRTGRRRLQALRGAGPKGDKGDSGLTGAFYATALYNAGNTNAGAIAARGVRRRPREDRLRRHLRWRAGARPR